MTLSTNTNPRPVKAIALALAVAALAVTAAHASGTPDGKYGPLDPWAYAVIHGHAQSVTPDGKYGPLDPWAYSVIHRTRETSAGRSPASAPEIQAGIGSNSVDQDRTAETAAPSNLGTTLLEPNGFDWGDAGVGAAGALAIVLLAAGTQLAVRKRRGLAHVDF
jgi:hypothetical protein